MSQTPFAPKTRQFNEREITRNQTDFSGGLYKDVPDVPNNGLSKLVDMVNKGNYLEGGLGCRQWGNYSSGAVGASLPSLSGRTGYSVTKSGSTVTKTVGADFTSADVGNYIVYDDGVHERIEAYLNINTVTVDSTTAHAASTAAYIRGPVNAVYYHKTQKKILIHIDTRIFVASDIYVGSWVQAYCISYSTLQNSTSRFSEYQQYAYLFNANGIFKLDLSESTYLYYKINSSIPTVKLTDDRAAQIGDETTTDVSETNYVRRFTYTMSRISGTGLRDRTTPNSYLRHETGSTKLNSDLKDYGEYVHHTQDNHYAKTMGTFTYPSNENHYNFYSVYGTKNVGINGADAVTGIGNDPELYVWLADVPVAKPFMVTIEDTPSYSVVTASQGTFESYDVGATIKVGANTYTILLLSDVVDGRSTKACIAGSVTLESPTAACIGSSTVFTASQSGYLVTISGASFNPDTDSTKTIFWADGTYSYISNIVDGTNAYVTDSTTRNSVVGCITPTSRKITTQVYDETLDARLSAGYVLNQRFWEPLPYSDDGIIIAGFMVTIRRNYGHVYYSQMPVGFEYLAGQYYSPFQYLYIKDNIQLLTEHSSRIIVWCKNSRYGIPTDVTETKEQKSVGTSYTVLPNQYIIDNFVGINDYSGWCYVDNDVVFFITNEPGCRVFNGEEDSEDLAHGRISSDLIKMFPYYSVSYDMFNGVTIWGKE